MKKSQLLKTIRMAKRVITDKKTTFPPEGTKERARAIEALTLLNEAIDCLSSPKERWIMGVANQDLFKEDRRQEKTLKEIKEFAKRYSIRLDGLSDEEIIQRWNARPKWD